MCARALVMFLLACACSVFLNAGGSFENSCQRVLIELVLHCYGNGNKSEARATPVDDRRPRVKDLAKRWCGASANTGCQPWVHHCTWEETVHVNECICFGSATPTCMGDHESLDAGGALVEVTWKWMWLR